MGVRLVAAISSSRDLPPLGDWLITKSAPVAVIRLTKTKILALLQLFCFQTSGSSGAVPRGARRPVRYCERRGAWQHGVAQVRRRGSIRTRRHGAAQVQWCEKARARRDGTMRTRHHGAARVQWREKARARRCGGGWCRCDAWSERGAAPWDGADSALWGAPAVTS